MAITVRKIGASDFEAWDRYVFAHEAGTFCHLAGWKSVVEQGAQQDCPYLVAEQDGDVVGVLPLTLRRSRLFGDALISSMFAVYGGALATNDKAYEALDAAAWRIAQGAGLQTISYKTVNARHKGEAGWSVDATTAATFKKPLKKTADEILVDIPRKQRAVVRKSLQNGLVCRWEKDLETFYALYAVSVRNLGTPVFPKAMFQAFLTVFEDLVEIQNIYAPSGKPVASLMSFYHGDEVLPYYAGGDVDARQYGAHDFMYYQLMLRAAKKGKKVFDFGRSKTGSGPYKFKKNWGFEPTPLEYEYRLENNAAVPDLSPTNRKFELMVKMWKRLPLKLANTIGPPIARHLG